MRITYATRCLVSPPPSLAQEESVHLTGFSMPLKYIRKHEEEVQGLFQLKKE